jgi:hypothetical protein
VDVLIFSGLTLHVFATARRDNDVDARLCTVPRFGLRFRWQIGQSEIVNCTGNGADKFAQHCKHRVSSSRGFS